MSILESLLGLTMLVVIILGAGAIFNQYWQMSNKQKNMTEGNDLSVMILSDVMQTKYSSIVNLCNTTGAWTLRTSACKTINFNLAAAPIDVQPIVNFPFYSSLLAKNLAGFASAGPKAKSCIDLVLCKKLISSDLLELSFQYFYPGSKPGEVLDDTIILRRGPW